MPIWSPSDPLRAVPFQLGGRVLAREGEGGVHVRLGDAFGARPLLVASRVDFAVGDLVVVDVASISADGRLVVSKVEVVGRDRRPIDAPLGERARLDGRSRARLLRKRAELLDEIRAFFAERDFLEVETPTLVPSPGLDLHLDAFAVEPPRASHVSITEAEYAPLPDGGFEVVPRSLHGSPDSRARFLSTSPEYQMKRLLVAGVPRLFQLTRAYRQGEVGARHNPEFTILEWYRAYASFEEIIAETEALIVRVVATASGRPSVAIGGRTIDLTPPFERLPICRAFARHVRSPRMTEAEALSLGLSRDPDDEARWFRLLVDEVEPRLAEGQPVVLLDYPSSQASLARLKNDDARLAERFEVFIGGVELCNGFGELADPKEQRARFVADQRARRAQGKPVYPIDERFLAALDEGMPPACGNALGVDRLVAIATGASELGDVLSFPEGWL